MGLLVVDVAQEMGPHGQVELLGLLHHVVRVGVSLLLDSDVLGNFLGVVVQVGGDVHASLSNKLGVISLERFDLAVGEIVDFVVQQLGVLGNRSLGADARKVQGPPEQVREVVVVLDHLLIMRL